MVKRDKNFKLSKESKRQLATIIDPLRRGHFKNSMIEAELSASIPFKSEKNKIETQKVE
jgi:hypothetical protein